MEKRRQQLRGVTLKLQPYLISEIEKLVEQGVFPTFSEAIRYSVLTMLRMMTMEKDDDALRQLIDEIVTLRSEIARLEQKIEQLQKRKKKQNI